MTDKPRMLTLQVMLPYDEAVGLPDTLVMASEACYNALSYDVLPRRLERLVAPAQVALADALSIPPLPDDVREEAAESLKWLRIQEAVNALFQTYQNAVLKNIPLPPPGNLYLHAMQAYHKEFGHAHTSDDGSAT